MAVPTPGTTDPIAVPPATAPSHLAGRRLERRRGNNLDHLLPEHLRGDLLNDHERYATGRHRACASQPLLPSLQRAAAGDEVSMEGRLDDFLQRRRIRETSKLGVLRLHPVLIEDLSDPSLVLPPRLFVDGNHRFECTLDAPIPLFLPEVSRSIFSAMNSSRRPRSIMPMRA